MYIYIPKGASEFIAKLRGNGFLAVFMPNPRESSRLHVQVQVNVQVKFFSFLLPKEQFCMQMQIDKYYKAYFLLKGILIQKKKMDCAKLI